MEKVSKILKKFFYGILAVALIIVVVFETGILTPGGLGGNKAAEFPVLTAMELLTVCLIPFSLYLFRVKSVRQNLLAAPAQSMLTWGFVRMAMLAVSRDCQRGMLLPLYEPLVRLYGYHQLPSACSSSIPHWADARKRLLTITITITLTLTITITKTITCNRFLQKTLSE